MRHPRRHKKQDSSVKVNLGKIKKAARAAKRQVTKNG